MTVTSRGVRQWCPSLLCIALVAGCGGDSEPPTSTGAKRAEPIPDAQVSREVKRHADRLAATMRRLGSTLELAECDQVPRITELRDRMLAQSRRFSAYQTEPAFRDDITSIRATVGALDSEIDALIQDCREQRKLEQAADEANRLADEIEDEATPP